MRLIAVTFYQVFKPSLVIASLLLIACGSSDSDTAANSAPVANAGADISLVITSLANLNGTGSSDLDNDPLSYNWVFTTIPSGSNVSLNGATSSQPDFTPDITGSYQLSLIVNDGQLNSSEDLVNVTATTELYRSRLKFTHI